MKHAKFHSIILYLLLFLALLLLIGCGGEGSITSNAVKDSEQQQDSCEAISCSDGKICADGNCICEDDKKECNGKCIEKDNCCSDDGCSENEICSGNQCVNPCKNVQCKLNEICEKGKCVCKDGFHECEDACIKDGTCCNDADCEDNQKCEASTCTTECSKLIDKEAKSKCYVDLAVKKKDESYCKKAHAKDQDSCYHQVALNKSDRGICKFIDNSDIKNYCTIKIAKKLKDVSICNDNSDLKYRNICVANVAIASKDYKICEKGDFNKANWEFPYDYDKHKETFPGADAVCERNTESQSYCYNLYAKKTGDVDACKEIKAVYRYYLFYEWGAPIEGYCHDHCIWQVAFTTGDINICFNSKYSRRRMERECIYPLLHNNNDEKVCEKISDQKIKDRCYHYVATRNLDISYCDEIKNSSRKEKCYDDLY